MKNKSIFFLSLALLFLHCNQKNYSSDNENITESYKEAKDEKPVENQKINDTAQGKLRYYADAFSFTFCDKEKAYFVKPDKSLLEFERIILNIDEQYIFVETNYLIEEIMNEDGLLSKQITLENIQQIEACE